MAQFANLHIVGQVLVALIKEATSISNVSTGPPIEVADQALEGVRVTLMWVTPQPTHRSDPWERDAGGTLSPPLVTLSGFYLVTTYGNVSDSDMAQAHSLLGQILEVFHRRPALDLPVNLNTVNTVDSGGSGKLGVVQMPTEADMLEKIFSSLQLRHRPWVLFDVAPIQIASELQKLGEPEIVHPGGVRFSGVEVLTRPVIERITPSPASRGGRIRVDARYTGTVLRVTAGTASFTGGDLLIPSAGGPVFLVLPTAGSNNVTAGSHDVTLTTDNVTSAAVSLTVRGEEIPAVDPPSTPTHSIANPLTLDGHALGGAQELVAWPDEGVAAPSEVKHLSLINVSNTGVTVAAADLGQADLRPTTYRLAVRHSLHGFTPYVLLEFTP